LESAPGRRAVTFETWLSSYQWLCERELPCIVRANLCGLACGLLQRATLNWNLVGTFDCQTVCLYRAPNAVDWRRVVFLDSEILRDNVHSVGNRLFALDSADALQLLKTYPHCINPNLWQTVGIREGGRGIYPFSTLALLLASFAIRDAGYDVSDPWLALTLHADSTFIRAAFSPNNALDWLTAMRAGSNSAGLARFCRLLERLRAQTALKMLNAVQSWAADSGFGGKQRACRFDPQVARDRERAAALVERLRHETGASCDLPLAAQPTYVETFETRELPIDSIGRQKQSFAFARDERVISMAATGRTAEGLQVTLPNPHGRIAALH
jgi:hypothetical protein